MRGWGLRVRDLAHFVFFQVHVSFVLVMHRGLVKSAARCNECFWVWIWSTLYGMVCRYGWVGVVVLNTTLHQMEIL